MILQHRIADRTGACGAALLGLFLLLSLPLLGACTAHGGGSAGGGSGNPGSGKGGPENGGSGATRGTAARTLPALHSGDLVGWFDGEEAGMWAGGQLARYLTKVDTLIDQLRSHLSDVHGVANRSKVEGRVLQPQHPQT